MIYIVLVLSVVVLVIAMRLRVLIGIVDDKIEIMRKCISAIEEVSHDAMGAICRLEQLAGELLVDIEEATSTSREAKESAASAFEYSEITYEYARDNACMLSSLIETVGSIDEKVSSMPVSNVPVSGAPASDAPALEGNDDEG